MFRRIATVALVSAFLVAPGLAQRPKAAERQQQQQLKKALKQGRNKAQDQAERKAKRADGQQIQKLQRALKLTDAQSEQFRGLMATRDQELAQLKAAGKGQRKETAQAIRDRFQMGLRAILSPEQAQLFESKRSGRKAQLP